VFIRGKEILWPAIDISEIAAPSPRDQDFLPKAIAMFKQGNAPPAFAGLDRAQESCRAAAKNHSVKVVNQE
jgi:hypothetical protein